MTTPIRKDAVKFPIQTGAELLIFHKDLPIGKGSAVSLYIYDIEVIKFDCFGKDKGHYHIMTAPNCQRIFFKEDTVIDQIERSMFELTVNIQTYLSWSRNKRIKTFPLNLDALKNISESAKDKMLEYEGKYSRASI